MCLWLQAAAFHEGIMKDALGLVKALGSIKRLDSKALSHELLDAALSAVFQQVSIVHSCRAAL